MTRRERARRALWRRRRVSRRGVALVIAFEGFRSRPYRDAVGVETIGYGETDPRIISRYRHGGITKRAARRVLRRRLNQDYAPAVRDLGLALGQPSFDALTSFAYNVGIGALAASTGIGRALRAGRPRVAADELLEWDKAGGRRLEGLARRRRAERDLFLRGIPRRANRS